MNKGAADVRRAVQAAVEFLDAAFGSGASDNAVLEEVELDDADFWYVTLSLPVGSEPGVFAGLAGVRRRDYKVFKIDRASGEVLSMKIRAQPEAT